MFDARELKEGGCWKSIHICTREMARYINGNRKYDGVVKRGSARGMKYILVEAGSVEETRKKIEEYLKK